MLSLSINKKLDYASPIMFVALGTSYSAKATKDKPASKPVAIHKSTPTQPTQKKAPVNPIAHTTINKPAPSPKPTTIAATPIKKEETKKETPPVVKKTEEVKKEVAKKPESIKQEVVKKETVKAEPVKPTPVATALDTQQTVVPVIPDNAHVSHNYREVEALRKQAQLQKEIVQKWTPPIGVSPDCMCEISFFVTQSGKIDNIKMIKGSGVMMFDISVRQALFAIKMPQWTYGKPFTIEFRQ